ncbi:MarR family winged helix-turn-helix transcriptional regulator [soil metagenome]
MYNTDNIANLGEVLVELIGFFSAPQRVELLLHEAEVELDRALFPLLVCLATRGPLSVAGLSDQIGRDHTTISRQLSKLESLGLVSRQEGDADRRVRTVRLTAAGEQIATSVTAARRRLLAKVLAEWSERDVAALAELNGRFVDARGQAARGAGPAGLRQALR